MHDDGRRRDRAVDDDAWVDVRPGDATDEGVVAGASAVVEAVGPCARASVGKEGWVGESRSRGDDAGVLNAEERLECTVGVVDQARMSAYRVAGRPVPTSDRVRRAMGHAARGAALAQRGEGDLALGATLAAATTLLRAAVTPARSEAEQLTKLRLLHAGVDRVGLDASYGHVVTLVDAALQAETDAMIEDGRPVTQLAVGDVPREAAGPARPTESATMADCSAGELELYADLASRTRDRMAALDAMVRSLTDEIELRRAGASDVARGAHVTLEDLDLTVCATLTWSAVDADDKERLLTGALAFHATRSPLVAAVIRAALGVEAERWGAPISGRA